MVTVTLPTPKAAGILYLWLSDIVVVWVVRGDVAMYTIFLVEDEPICLYGIESILKTLLSSMQCACSCKCGISTTKARRSML